MTALPNATRARAGRTCSAILVVALALATSVFGLASAALAHGEIIDASPGNNDVVGGEITEVAIQFIGIAHPGAHTISIKDPDGTSVIPTGSLEQDFLRLILPIEPLTKPGIHTVTAVVEGIDDDTVAVSYSFDYQPDAPPPEPIQYEQEFKTRFDAVTIGLIVASVASIIGFIFLIRHRLRITAPTATESADAGTDDDAANSDETGSDETARDETARDEIGSQETGRDKTGGVSAADL